MSHNKCYVKFTDSEIASSSTTGRCELCGEPASGRFCGSVCYSAWRRRTSAASIVPRFWSKVKVGRSDECWLWQASAIGSHGYRYGQFTGCDADGTPRRMYAHRFVCELTHGPLEPGQVAMHSCDEPLCCNPAHIKPGTQGDNLRDASAKGHFKVPRSTAHKVTTDQLPEVDACLAAGELQSDIAKRFGVSTVWVSLYARGLRRQYDRPVSAKRNKRKAA